MPSVLINTSTDGDTLVAAHANANAFIRVHGFDVTADGQVEVTLKSDTTVKWKTYATNDANVKGGIVKPFTADGWFDCDPGEALKIGLDGAVPVAGNLVYSYKGPTV